MADKTQGKDILWALSLLTVFAVLFVVLRFFAKRKYGKPIAADDHLLLAALIFLIVSFVLTMVAVGFGYGRNFGEIGSRPVEALQLVAASEFFAIGAVALGKTSVGITLLRLAIGRRQRFAIKALLALVNAVVWTSAVFIWVEIWTQRVIQICDNEQSLWGFAMFASAWSAFTDLVFALLPWSIIWRLQMQKAEKVGVGIMLSLGILSAIAAGIKIAYMDCTNLKTDIPHSSIPLVIWTFAEPAVIIIATSIPVLRFFIKQASRNASQRRRHNLRRSESMPPYIRLGRSRWAVLWPASRGSTEISIPLETLGGDGRAGRTDEGHVGAAESSSGTHNIVARPGRALTRHRN